MGGTSLGTSPQRIADAVNRYTNTYDAFVDLVAADFEVEEFISRQITSIDSRRPSIAIINNGFHAVIVIGGSWHDLDNGNRQWDYTIFHDPQTTSSIQRASAHWIAESCPEGSTCQQIVGANAVSSAGSNLSTYGDTTCLSGGGCKEPYQQF